MTRWWRFAPALKVTRRDLALFTRSLARLLQAGLPLADAVRLAAAVPGGALSAMADDLCAEIRSGASLSLALGRHDPAHQPVFGPVFRALINAAEAGGVMGRSLDRLADYTERAEQLSQSVRSALVYPVLLLGAALVSLVVLLVVVVPRFEALFAGLGHDVPLLTSVIIGGAGLLRNYGWAPLAAGVAAIFYWRHRAHDPDFRAAIDARLVRMPQFGPVLVKIILERVARSLSELLQNGVSLPEALTLASAIAGNRLYGDGLLRAGGQVREGQSLSIALAQNDLFPELMLRLVRVGEESSALAEMLAHLADIYSMEVEAIARRLLALLEPVLVLLIGGVMAVIIIGLVGAITGINDLAVQ
ncbi:MAG: type II secretion system F family protein [Alphaproteobacteria bacterium]